MKPKSDNLFHFTKSLDVLKLILKNGIYPRFCLEDIEWFGLDEHKHWAFPMSCFCDIPLSRISEHTNFYGSYGIGLTKDWGMKNELNPVVYSPHGGNIQTLMKYLFYLKMPNKDFKQELDGHSYKLWSLLKPITGTMLIGGEFVEKEFYQENEWRYVPPVQDIITYDSDYEEEREKANKDIEKHKLEIAPEDIRYFFVNSDSDSDIPSLVDFINMELDRFPLNDLKILQSRIVSLDTLSRDL